MSFTAQTQQQRTEYIEVSRANGNDIVCGNDKYLQLDLDTPGDYDKALDKIRKFKSHLPILAVFTTRSKSNNRHLHIKLAKPMPRKERIFWQCALGSDATREALSWVWVEEGHKEEAFLVEVSGRNVEEIMIGEFKEPHVVQIQQPALTPNASPVYTDVSDAFEL